MNDDVLRAVLAGILGPIFWGLVGYVAWRIKWLLPGAGERAARYRARREQALQRSHGFGRKLGRWLGRRRGRL